MFRSIRFKIISLISTLIGFTLLASLMLTNWTLGKSQQNVIAESFERTERVVATFIETQRFNLLTQARLVGILPILTTVVDNGDPATILNSSKSFQKQLKVPIFDVLDEDGGVLASVGSDFPEEIPKETETLISQVFEENCCETSLSIRQKQLVLLATAPVGVPDEPSGVLMIGVYLNNDFAVQIKTLTEADISFLVDGEIVSSSLALETQTILKEVLQNQVMQEEPHFLNLENQRFLVTPLKNMQGQIIGHMLIQRSLEGFQEVISDVRKFLLYLGGGIFIIAFGCGLLISARITNPISIMVAALREIASGNFTQEIKVKTRDELRDLSEMMNQMVDELSMVLDNVRAAANGVAKESKEVSNFNASISDSASRQKTYLSELSETVNQFNEKSTENSLNASKAEEIVQTASLSIEKGNEHMHTLVTAMADIESSSKNISKIIRVIDDVAFQTNLLALNAAVEAARAGIHGKGFAVVANEVRSLAVQSSKAAQETSSFITESVKNITEGMKIAEDTAGIFSDILIGIEQVNEHVGKINQASQEQLGGIKQINFGLSQFEEMTIQNVDMTEDGTQISVRLTSHAASLQETISGFHLKSQEGNQTEEDQ